MKISKSKQELARIISENGGWRDGAESAVQCKLDDAVSFYRDIPYRDGDCWWGEHLDGCDIGQDRLIANWHQAILSRSEYFHLYPVPDADGWIEWNGGDCPVDKYARIDIRMTGGTTHYDTDTHWGWNADSFKITHYRLHKPQKSEPQYCESVTRSIPEPIAAPTIEQLAADYRNAKDYAERKQQEADAAKNGADAKLAELVAAGKAIGLVLSVEHEVSVITPALPPIIPGDLMSWHQWEVGDFISWSIVGHSGEFRIISVHHDPSRNIGDFEVEDKQGGVYRVYSDECRFIRRP